MEMNFAIILASGSGKRMHNHTPKQFLELHEKPLIYYSLKSFEECEDIDEIIVTVQKKHFAMMYQIIEQYSFNKVHMLVTGGKTRQESVWNALNSLKGFAMASDNVIIHDSARPLIASSTITNLLMQVEKYKAVTLASSLSDTIIKKNGNYYDTIVPREDLLRIETPQAFKYNLILRAHRNALAHEITNASDDAQLVKLLDKKVRIIINDKNNLKVTTASDLILIEPLLEREN